MQCAIDTVLLEQFVKATERYCTAVSDLSDVTGLVESNRPSFSDAYKRAEQEHQECKHARKAMEQHRSEHHCH